MVEKNLGLVHSCVHRFTGRGIEYDDMYQAGCMGLVKAIKGFDKSRGIMFSTYAVPVILGEIRRLFRDGGTVKVSRSVKELGLKAVRCKEYLEKKMGREVHISEIAKELEVSENDVTEALTATMPTVSLTVNEDEGGGQMDIPTEYLDDHLSDVLSLKQLISELPSQDRMIIYYRFYKEYTQSKTAEKLNMTQVQVSRKEKKILKFLYQKLNS